VKRQERHRFAVERLSNGGAGTLERSVEQWHSRRDGEESIAAFRESLAQ
jgi:hypothetical protein